MKERQSRLTLEDTLLYQEELRVLLKRLIQHNRPLTDDERQEFYRMIPKALLSQANSKSITYAYGKGWFQFPSVAAFALRLADMDSDKIMLKTIHPQSVVIPVNISQLWQFLYDWCIFLFPKACSESLHMSSELPIKQKAGTYSFSNVEAKK